MMNNSDTDRLSIRNYGIHGAIGLLTGAGTGAIFTVLPFMILGIGSPDTAYLIRFGFNLVAVTVFGVYLGHIFDNRKQLSRLGAIAGIVCGSIAALSGGFLGDVYGETATYIIILGIAGLIFGVPEIRRMVLLAASGVLGGTAGSGLYYLGQHLTYFLKDIGTQQQFGIIFFLAVVLIMLILSVLAIGTAGASIGIGMYITGVTPYSKRELPSFLKILRIAGTGLIIVVLAVMTLMFVSYADYASASSTIHMTSDADVTVYVPVLLDGDGNVLEMYEDPAVSGDATAEIITSEHGTILRIRGSGNVDINMRESRGIQRGKQLKEAFAGFGVSTGNYTAGEDVRMTDVWIYSEGDINDLGMSLNLDTGWGQILTIGTENDFDPVEGWQVVTFSVRTMAYD